LFEYINKDNTIPVDGIIVIEEFHIRVQVVEYDEITKIKLIEELLQ